MRRKGGKIGDPNQMTFDQADSDKNGVIDRSEWERMNYEFERERLADENAKRDAQRKMTWFALLGMLLYPFGVIFASLLGLGQAADIIGSMASIYFVSIAAIVGAFFGFSNMSSKTTVTPTKVTHEEKYSSSSAK